MSHVSKLYPKQISALSDVSVEVPQGEFAYITGPSGSGKTTLLRILFCAVKPTSGEIEVNGFHITKKGFNRIYELRRTMGIVFQDAKLLQDRTVSANVAFPLEVTGQRRDGIQQKVQTVLSQVGLQGREEDPIMVLSAGEQQRVAIARALVNSPSLLLVDEPTGCLDAQIINEVMQIFTGLQQTGTTVLFATQNDDLIRRYPAQVIRLSAGKRVDEATRDEIIAEA